ncbi:MULTISPECIES: Gfo/Idh/MocA family protein [unclassified Streptomyces]|uniref:Gfo/Idh/MocA family protein n=1 Tax=unclassified Streptomyces TaxID=2593676 RepID=UPI001661BAC0|nr:MULTISPECIES: Gfo/Idh/MocA family oxidoreductase [unclassified Streptomyces]MBD0841735.1 Gfo/Idh/MocA family oxidoreductase [Streptomyces sp. TRM68416]
MEHTNQQAGRSSQLPDETAGVVFVGCGYAADFYGATMPNYPHVEVKGAYDHDRDRAATFVAEYSGRVFADFDEVLSDPDVSVVVNLTPVSEHYRVSKAALLAGKHVYSEKPLAPRLPEATELVELAQERGLLLSSAPSTVFSRSAQTLLRAVGDGMIGTPRLVHASLDMGALAFMPYTQWRSRRGVPWPYRDEVANGCVMEHAGYQLSWLVAMLGPVVRMAAHTSLQLGGEWPDPGELAPDVSLGFLEFAGGAVCRLSIGWVAPADLSLTVIGDRGVLSVGDVWQASAPVVLRRNVPTRGKTNSYLGEPEQLPFVAPPTRYRYADTHDLTVGAGVADLASAVLNKGEPFLSAGFCLHVLDVSLRLAAGRGVMEDVPPPSCPA